MIALRLVRLIETHSGPLSEALRETLVSSPECADLRKIPPADLVERASEIYRHLSDWLINRSEEDIARTFGEVGFRRAEQGVAFSHVAWAIRATKENLLRFVEREGFAETPVELYGSLELFILLDRFFDSALYHAAVAYERYLAIYGGIREARVA
jgi:hypothetical protein